MSNIKGLSLFANVGIGELLLKEVGVDIVVANELLKERAKFYSANHPDSKMIQGDITDPKIFKEVMDESIKNQVQFIMATPPCFVAGTKVLTEQGYKNIEDITSSDRVLTHNNRFRKVVTPMSKITTQVVYVKIKGSPVLETTYEHPFYVRSKGDSMSSPYWKNASDLNVNDLIGINIEELRVTVSDGFLFEGTLEECLNISRKLNNTGVHPVIQPKDSNFQLYLETTSQKELVIDDKIWIPVESVVCTTKQPTKVYNMEVEEDNSYTVNNFIVHNCQGMSMAGKMDENDPRNLLILKVIEAVKLIKPQYTLIENVPQMLKSYISVKGKKVLIIDHLKDQLSKDYNITFKVVDAADYETPQYRKRAIIVLVKKELGNYEFPKTFKHISVHNAIGHLPSLEAGEKSKIKHHEAKPHNNRHIDWMKHTPTGNTAFNNPDNYPQKDGRRIKGFMTTYKRMDWDRPAPTVTMANGSISSQNNVHPGRPKKDGTYSDARVLTVKELMLISGIPESWVIPSFASDNLIRHVIGEMVPPKLIYYLIKQLNIKKVDLNK